MSLNHDIDCDSVILTPFQKSHISPDYISWFNDQEVCKFNRHGQSEYTKAAALEYYQQNKSNESQYTFAILDKSENLHIGNVSLASISLHHRSAEISIIIGNKKYWGKGIGYQCFHAMTKYGFKTHKLHKIKIGFFQENASMRRICEKLNYQHEATLVDEIIKNGNFVTIEKWAKFSTDH